MVRLSRPAHVLYQLYSPFRHSTLPGARGNHGDLRSSTYIPVTSPRVTTGAAGATTVGVARYRTDVVDCGVERRLGGRRRPIPDQVRFQTLFLIAARRDGILSTTPRVTISAAISRLTRRLMGRPEMLGTSRARPMFGPTCFTGQAGYNVFLA